jgi:hypothetical protein
VDYLFIFIYSLSYPLNIAILWDEGADYVKVKKGKGTTAPLVLNIEKLGNEKIPFVASYPLFVALKEERPDAFNKLLDSKEWALYLLKGNKLIVALPKSYWKNIDVSKKEHLFSIGLNKDTLSYKNPSEFEQFIDAQKVLLEEKFESDPETSLITLDIKGLKDLLVNPEARKRLYLSGHGSYTTRLLLSPESESVIAGIPINQYRDFLKFLNTAGTDLLFVASCYAGGQNFIEIQERDEKGIKELYLNYFLIVAAVTDLVVKGKVITNFQQFFKDANTFFVPTTKQPPLESLFNAADRIKNNIPSIRFPGSINYFKAIGVDGKTQIITYATATAKSLDFKSGRIKSWPIINKKIILLYPIKTDVPLTIKAENLTPEVPELISMIPGHAFHRLKSIEIPQHSLHEVG